MPANQIYEAMSQRVVDGFGMPFEALPPFRLHEVSRYHTEVGMYTTAFATFMNQARYESLPADVRKVLDETTSAASGYWRRVGESWDRAEVVGRKAVVDGMRPIERRATPPAGGFGRDRAAGPTGEPVAARTGRCR